MAQTGTLAPENRVRVKLKPLQHGAGVLFCDPVFIGLTVAVNAVGFFASSHLAAPLGERFGTVAGGVTISLTGLFFDGTALPMVAAMALCALSAWGLALLVLPRLAESGQQAAE